MKNKTLSIIHSFRSVTLNFEYLFIRIKEEIQSKNHILRVSSLHVIYFESEYISTLEST